MGHAVFVFGAAGVGKTTFCKNLKESRQGSCNIKLINMDPAQENAAEYDIDLCEHITVEDVMEHCDFGPNGALFYALQETVENIEELSLHEMEEDYIVFDCPGQIELFLHSDIFISLIDYVKKFSKVAIVYLSDSTNFNTSNKHIYTALCATLCMSRFLLPVLNILTKVDLIDEEALESILESKDTEINDTSNEEYSRLNRVICDYINYNGMLDYIPLDWNNESMVENIFFQLDNVLQRYDDVEPDEHRED